MTYPGQIDGSGSNVDVHQVINHTALDVPFVTVHDDFVPGVDDFHERHVALFSLVHRLVSVLIMLDPQQEISQSSIFVIQHGVIGAVDFHFLQKKHDVPRYLK